MNTQNYETVNQIIPHKNTSEEYKFVSTADALKVCADLGWFPSKVMEASIRNPENKGFQKHIVRLQNSEFKDASTVPEIVIVNSHLGNCSFQLYAGILEIVCLNGLICGKKFNETRIVHKKYNDLNFENAIRSIASRIPECMGDIDTFKSTVLTPDEEKIFCETALKLVFDEELQKWEIDPNELVKCYHYKQKAPTLYHTFNKIQENVIRGGVRRQDKQTGKRLRTRAIRSVDENVKLNRALWDLTTGMAKLKGAA